MFLDEADIPVFEGITAHVSAALRDSRVLVAWYAADYAGSRACQ